MHTVYLGKKHEKNKTLRPILKQSAMKQAGGNLMIWIRYAVSRPEWPGIPEEPVQSKLHHKIPQLNIKPSVYDPKLITS